MADQKQSVTILWGQNPKADGREPIEYEFNTEGELKAFLKGIAEADGWEGWDEIEDEDSPPEKVKILWGENPNLNEKDATDYYFETGQEAESFIKGISEANGWYDYTVIEKNGEKID